MGVSGGLDVIGVKALAKSQYIGKSAMTVETISAIHAITAYQFMEKRRRGSLTLLILEKYLYQLT